MLWWLLRNEKALFAFLPLSLARPLVDAGEVREVELPTTSPIEPLGLPGPSAEAAEAVELLGAHLHERFA